MSKIKEANLWIVTVRNTAGVEWQRHFANLPTKEQVLLVMQYDADDADASSGRTEYIQLLRQIVGDHYPVAPLTNADHKCHYGGVQVGLIRAKNVTKVVMEVST